MLSNILFSLLLLLLLLLLLKSLVVKIIGGIFRLRCIKCLSFSLALAIAKKGKQKYFTGKKRHSQDLVNSWLSFVSVGMYRYYCFCCCVDFYPPGDCGQLAVSVSEEDGVLVSRGMDEETEKGTEGVLVADTDMITISMTGLFLIIGICLLKICTCKHSSASHIKYEQWKLTSI